MEEHQRTAGPEEVSAFDVVVVGGGAAGTVAAIEAAENGARVVVLDRWGRGGASARSGGIIYAGGGTDQQVRAGFDDDPGQMASYLSWEAGPALDAELIEAFCRRSREDLGWLQDHGVAFPPGFDPGKSVTPTDDGVGLYFSGNEKHFAGSASPIARGHRVAGVGMTGRDLMAALHRAARARGVSFHDRVKLTGLAHDGHGAVTGVEALALDRSRTDRLAHAGAYRAVDAAAALLHQVPRRLGDAVTRWEQAHARVVRYAAPQGVVLATGGFAFNHSMMGREAPAYVGAMPLGTPGDDGTGIAVARALGAGVRFMDRCGASRFIAPPLGFCAGVLVDGAGERICDESLYAATLSAHIAAHGGRAWLVFDEPVRREIRAQVERARHIGRHSLGDLVSGRINHVLFPFLFGSVNLYANRVSAADLDTLARRCGISPGGLARTIETYNADIVAGAGDRLGKPTELLRPVREGPFTAVACHLQGWLFPAPCITLGGLAVDGTTQQVQRADGSTIAGLYAVGRCAAGVASASYVSGLSLADCVFSGRNAGRAVAGPH